MNDQTKLRQVATIWRAIQGADLDIVNGRPVDDALEEKAALAADLDALLADVPNGKF